jgi:hypothetical protein
VETNLEGAMSTLARIIGKKAAKATVRHSAHGVAAKARRQPLRSATLIGLGAAVGAGVGWFAGRYS